MITTAKSVQPFSLLDPVQVEMIHRASMQILEETGLRMPLSPERYDFLEEKGARVDREKKLVRFPESLVLEAIKSAPKSYTLFARSGDGHLPLDGTVSYLTLDGTGLEVLDNGTGGGRSSTFDDLSEAVRLADALPQISFLWPPVSARDRPARVQPLYELFAMMKNSGKHAQAMTAVDPIAAEGSAAMAAEAAGGKDALREKPVISSFQCSISPLCYDGDSLEAALVFARAGIPAGFMNMSIGCATAPATLAGNLAVINAELLGGISFLQAFHPGAPTFYGTCATMMDMKTGGITAGGPYDCLLQSAGAGLARHYGLPSSIGTFATGAGNSGWQAGAENSLSCAASILSGADMICGAGLIRGAKVFSPAQLVLDCEIFDMVRHFASGIVVNEDTLALDAVRRVGPGNHFLTDDNTLKHMRSFWRPSYADLPPGEGPGRGSNNPARQAIDRAREILESHEPPPLPREKAIREILEKYEKEYT